MQPVEGVGEIDEPALGLDRRNGVCEGHPAWDLLGEEEPDHLALAVGLDLLARDHDQVPVACELDGLERPSEGVVIRDGDRPEPLRLGVVEQVLDFDGAVVRPRRVQMEVGEDPVAVGERLRRASATPSVPEIGVELLELACDVREGLALDAAPRFLRQALSQRLVLGQPCQRRGGELRLLLDSRR